MSTMPSQKKVSIAVAEVMRAASAVCHPWDTLAQASEVMRDRTTAWLPVVAGGGRVVGVITARDACLAALARGRALDAVPVEGAMHTDVHGCSADSDVEDVLSAMQNYRVQRMPVMDADGKLVGEVALTDLARHVLPRGLEGILARTLASLAEPRSAVAPV
jgi:CBS domain-containing protein